MRSSKAPSELAAAAAANTAAAANLLLRKHQIASIFQHYYPEGHWGYVVLLCAFLVQVSIKFSCFCICLNTFCLFARPILA